jgi:DNA-directed RNA polymerase subunit RPC12/RpoP
MNKFSMNVIPESIRLKMQNAECVARTMPSRDLKCPHCGFKTETVYTDTAGHFEVKCRKCRRKIVYNLTPGTVLDFRISKG